MSRQFLPQLKIIGCERQTISVNHLLRGIPPFIDQYKRLLVFDSQEPDATAADCKT